MNSKLVLLLATGLASMALLAGCGDDSEAPDPTPEPSAAARGSENAPPPSAKSSPDQPPAPIAGLSEELRVKIEIPEYYPEDGPVYPGAKPSQAKQARNGRISLVFGTDAMPEEATSVMSEAAEAKGWTILSEDRMDHGMLTQAEKGSRKLMILTGRTDGGSGEPVTMVAVSVDP